MVEVLLAKIYGAPEIVRISVVGPYFQWPKWIFLGVGFLRWVVMAKESHPRRTFRVRGRRPLLLG